MGQETSAVLFGAKNSSQDLYDESHVLDDEGPKGPADTWNGSLGYGVSAGASRLRTATTDDVHGFAVALDRSRIVGVPHLSLVGSVPLDEFATTEPFVQSIKRARGLWERFRAHALAAGVPLPEGRLYLTTIEVA